MFPKEPSLLIAQFLVSHEDLIAILLHLGLSFGILLSMVQDSIQTLRCHGYKATRPRKQVLEALEQTQKPLSPYDIQRLLQEQGKYLNHVTIYRVLDLFCSLNLAHKVLSNGGFVKCSLCTSEGCHRFMVCQHCGAIQEFADNDLCQDENEFAQTFGFHTEYHLSEFSGLCSGCYETSSASKDES